MVLSDEVVDDVEWVAQIVKHGGKEERNGIAIELDGLYKQMLESKYSKVSLEHVPQVGVRGS